MTSLGRPRGPIRKSPMLFEARTGRGPEDFPEHLGVSLSGTPHRQRAVHGTRWPGQTPSESLSLHRFRAAVSTLPLPATLRTKDLAIPPHGGRAAAGGVGWGPRDGSDLRAQRVIGYRGER